MGDVEEVGLSASLEQVELTSLDQVEDELLT